VTTLVQDIVSALSALAPAGGVWNAVNTAEPAVYPYCVFTRIVSTTNNSFSGASNLQNTRVQVDFYDRSYRSASALSVSASAAIAAAFPTSVQISSFDAYEDAVKAFRVSADYSIWATN
jgi:hypothetical protein